MNKRPRIEITNCDITSLEAEAIVIPANITLLAGGGLSGIIHKKSGRQLQEERKKIANKEVQVPGFVTMTDGYKLEAQHVIHAIGPIWIDGNTSEDALLGLTYSNIFSLITRQKINSIAIPNISTGIHRFPKERAARIVFQILHNMLPVV